MKLNTQKLVIGLGIAAAAALLPGCASDAGAVEVAPVIETIEVIEDVEVEADYVADEVTEAEEIVKTVVMPNPDDVLRFGKQFFFDFDGNFHRMHGDNLIVLYHMRPHENFVPFFAVNQIVIAPERWTDESRTELADPVMRVFAFGEAGLDMALITVDGVEIVPTEVRNNYAVGFRSLLGYIGSMNSFSDTPNGTIAVFDYQDFANADIAYIRLTVNDTDVFYSFESAGEHIVDLRPGYVNNMATLAVARLTPRNVYFEKDANAFAAWLGIPEN